MMFKLNDYWRITSNTQFSTTSNVPRFDKLNDVEYSHLTSFDPKYLFWYYGPQNRFFSSINLQGFKQNKLFDRSEFILYQQVKESRNQQKVSEESMTIREEKVDIISLNSNFKKAIFPMGLKQY